MTGRRIAPALAAAILMILSGCGEAGPSDSGKVEVAAAEGFWGSLAAQLGGRRAEVTAIVSNPAADPHEYEPTAADARAFALSRIAIVNGIGYDEWATKLLDASPSSDREVVDVGALLGLREGDNPHQWYSPAAVERTINAITAAYQATDPSHAAYFAARRSHLEKFGLARYRRLLAEIRSRYSGTPVGASESVFEPLARALGLRLLTPRGFMDAVSEGAEPTPADKAAVERQIGKRRIAVWVYNRQNATPEVQRLGAAARAARIPVAAVTETPTPEGATFQGWMARELEGLEAALSSAGR